MITNNQSLCNTIDRVTKVKFARLYFILDTIARIESPVSLELIAYPTQLYSPAWQLQLLAFVER